MRMIWLLAALICLLGAFRALGGEKIPDGGVDVLPTADGASIAALKLQGSQAELGAARAIEVSGQPFKMALQLKTIPGAKGEWNVQVAADTIQDIQSGDVLLAHFFLRCTDSMTGEGSVGFVVEQNGVNFDKIAEQKVSAGGEWTEVFVPFRSAMTLPKGNAHVCLRIGYDRQTVEVGDLSVRNYASGVQLADLPRTKVTYSGRAADAPWRKAAWDRIDKYRKSDLTVRVEDAAGHPVSGAVVDVEMTRPEFRTGLAVNIRDLMGTGPDSERYREFVQRPQFNQMVFENEMKWPAVYGGIPQATDNALQWLLDKGLAVRGHNLIWGSWRWMPQELAQFKTDPEKLRVLTREHVKQTVEHFKGKLIQWDVVNEPFSEHDLTDLLGRPEMVEWFKIARAADPAAKLFINDYGIFNSAGSMNGHSQSYYDTIRFLKDSGAPLDGIGIQSHFAADLPSPMALMRTLDKFGEFGLPIESTEISFNCPDRDVQADYVRDYTIVMMSHPAVTGMIHWGFWSKAHWRPEAAFFGDDWTPRPSAKALEEIVRQFSTQASLTSGADGNVSVRGFHGEYQVRVTSAGRTETRHVTLSRDGTPGGGAQTIRVVLP